MRVLTLILLAIASVGFASAQETGPAAEVVKTKIVKIENEKVPIMLKGGEPYARWLGDHMNDDLVIVQPDGGFATKAQFIAKYRSHEFKVLKMTQVGHSVNVYANGTTAVVSYEGVGTFELNGKSSPVHQRFTDVWVKEHDAAWRRVSHNVHSLPVSATKGIPTAK
jgi:ketosteroid isomerase-like protein